MPEQLMFDFGDPPKEDDVANDGNWVYYPNYERDAIVAFMRAEAVIKYFENESGA